MVLERSRRRVFDVLFLALLGEESMASTSASMGGTTAAGQGLFTRQSSGLVRELGVPAATGIALASVAVVNTRTRRRRGGLPRAGTCRRTWRRARSQPPTGAAGSFRPG